VARLLPTEPGPAARGLAAVLERAAAEGLPEPAFVAVDDGSGGWFDEAARLAPRTRTRGVVAARDDAAFAAALRLGIGGALRLPPSTVGAREALAAAAAAELPPDGLDPAVGEALAAAGRPLAVLSFPDPAFWRAQLGERRLATMLAGLAERLQAAASLLPGPLLVLAEPVSEALDAAWRELRAARGGAAPALEMRPLGGGAGTAGVAWAAARTLEETAVWRSAAADSSWPVHELPGGRCVGRWAQVPVVLDREGWLATPIETGGGPRRWALTGQTGEALVGEALSAAGAADPDDVAALRLPGWAGLELRPGSPAALLAARLAEHAARRGLPLWLPNIDAVGLRLALGLPGRLWVDGPAVPG
jgi:hypothetical protein